MTAEVWKGALNDGDASFATATLAAPAEGA